MLYFWWETTFNFGTAIMILGRHLLCQFSDEAASNYSSDDVKYVNRIRPGDYILYSTNRAFSLPTHIIKWPTDIAVSMNGKIPWFYFDLNASWSQHKWLSCMIVLMKSYSFWCLSNLFDHFIWTSFASVIYLTWNYLYWPVTCFAPLPSHP